MQQCWTADYFRPRESQRDAQGSSTPLADRARQLMMNLVHDHQSRRMAVKKAQAQDLEVRASARVRRLMSQPLDDLGVELVVSGLGRHLKSQDFPDLDLPVLVADVGCSSTKYAQTPTKAVPGLPRAPFPNAANNTPTEGSREEIVA